MVLHDEFERIWPQIEPALQAKARGMLGYHDGQDVVQDAALHAVRNVGSYADAEHVKAYYLTMVRWRCLDAIRARAPLAEVIESDEDVRHDHDSVCAEIDVRELLDERICDALLDGHSLSEAARRGGISKATASRLLRRAKKRAADDERLLIGSSNTKQEGDDMTKDGQREVSDKLTVKQTEATKKGRMFRVYLEDRWVATAGYSNDTDEVSVVERGDALVSRTEVERLIREKVGAPVKAKRAAKKKAPIKLGGKLDEIVDFPPKLETWQRQSGGEGSCLCGCGARVAKRIMKGHDEKLKSAFKRVGTKNAKALAKAFGWDKAIKWS
jgi:DNA-directed RNA polymerase specialized sigma24 family protein